MTRSRSNRPVQSDFQNSAFKSPGTDGSQLVFFQTYWDVVGSEVWEMIAQNFNIGNINSALVETLIFLIPKIDSPVSLGDCRPIGLCNVLLKVISKEESLISLQMFLVFKLPRILATPIPDWLKHELESVVLNDNVEDIVIWDNACDGEYSAKSAYCCLT
ncbi:hypothetical protein JHK86_039724 [Glycine max]|nr:hypothetical protein JHK86_039724 [Glycine max]